MTINRKNWTKWFEPNNLPLWVCPTCKQNALILEQNSFKTYLTANSRYHQSHESWSPEDDSYRYNAVLVCSNHHCGEQVMSTGEGFVDFDCYYDYDGNTRTSHKVEFRPKYFNPSLDIFPLSNKVPKVLTVSIRKSFKLFFADFEASLNQLRTSIEILLNELNVDKFDNNGKQLNLHCRLDKLKTGEYAKYRNSLEAIKWLGNAGSHANDSVDIKMEDILDGYEIFQPIINELFDIREKSLEELVSAINTNKGPVK